MTDFQPTIHGAGRARPTRIERPPHPWASVQQVESAPATITGIMGEYHARRADLERRRQDFSKAEFDREVARLADFYRRSIISRAEEAQQHFRSTHTRAVAINKRLVREVPAADVDRAWKQLQPLFRVGIGLADIATRFGDDRATLEAIRFYGPNAIRGKARQLESPQIERGITDLLRHVDAVEEPHLPPDLAESRQAQRRVDAMVAVVDEHVGLARRELEGQKVPPQDLIVAGLREAEAKMADRTVISVTSVRAAR